MAGIDRPHAPAPDPLGHPPRGSRTIARVPFLAGVLRCRMYIGTHNPRVTAARAVAARADTPRSIDPREINGSPKPPLGARDSCAPKHARVSPQGSEAARAGGRGGGGGGGDSHTAGPRGWGRYTAAREVRRCACSGHRSGGPQRLRGRADPDTKGNGGNGGKWGEMESSTKQYGKCRNNFKSGRKMGEQGRENGMKYPFLTVPVPPEEQARSDGMGIRHRFCDPNISILPPPPPPPREVIEGREGGEGAVWDPTVCVPKMARQGFPRRKFRCVP